MQLIETKKEEREYLTIEQAMHYLQISRKTLYTWTKQGKLPCVRWSRLVRYRLEDLKAFAEQLPSSEEGAA